MEIDEKQKEIYEFLNAHRKYNRELQAKYYQSIIAAYNYPKGKLISLLYSVANTQSQPFLVDWRYFGRGEISWR